MSAAIVAALIILQNSENYSMPPAKTPKAPSNKSKTVLVALWLFAFALIGGVIATAVPAVGTLAVILAIVAAGTCVLSLREDL